MLLLDVLIATLLVFPWLTEGVELQVAGVDLGELSDLRIPLLAAGLAFVAARRLTRGSVREAAAFRPTKAFVRAAAGVLAAAIALAVSWPYLQLVVPGLDPVYVVWTLTKGTGAVLFVALVAVVLGRTSTEPWERSFFVRQAMALARLWPAAVARAPGWTLWSAAAAVGVVFFLNSLVRHWAFESHGYDLGIFTNVMWKLTHGEGYISSMKGGINLFADHQSPLFLLMALPFWLAPRPETLLFVQAFGLAAGGPALYYLTRARFGGEHWAPAALPWIYWAYLPLRNANAFDFHPEVFMLPLFLWAFAGFASARRGAKALGLLALIGALGAKESAAVVAVGLGVAWALSGGARARRGAWPGIALAAAGLALFFVNVKVVPRIFGGDYAYMDMYGRFGGGIVDVVLAPFTQPAYFFSQLLNFERVNFLFWTLAPLGFLPLFDWRAALAALPPYLMLFLSEGDQRVRIVFHYGIEPGSALFWGLPLGLAAFARRYGWPRAGVWMLVWALAAHGPTELGRARSYFQFLHAGWLGSEVIPCVNRDVALAASDSLVPHLATRSWVSYPNLLRQQPSGDPVRCVVTDLGVDNWPLGKARTRALWEELPAQGYREAWRCHNLRVHELGDSGCLRCVPKCY